MWSLVSQDFGLKKVYVVCEVVPPRIKVRATKSVFDTLSEGLQGVGDTHSGNSKGVRLGEGWARSVVGVTGWT